MHQREKARWLKHLDFMLLDVITVGVIFYIVCRVRMRMMHWSYDAVYRSTQIMVVLIAAFIVALLPMHKNILKRGPLHELAECLKFISILEIGVMLYHYLTQRGSLFSRSIFLIFWGVGVFAVWAVRSFYKMLLKKVFFERVTLPNMVVFASEERALEVYRSLTKFGKNRYQIDGMLIMDAAGNYLIPEEIKTERLGEIPEEIILTSLDEFDEYCLIKPVDEVFIDLDQQDVEKKLAKDLITMGITVHITLTKQFKGLPNQEIETYAGRSVMTSAVQSVSAGSLMVKRGMDIVGSVVGLVLTGIAFVIFAPIIYSQSKGPVFFAQTRVGLNGRRFRIYKFRSMYPGADKKKAELKKQNKMKGHMFKVENDPRIFPIGRFMRKYSIDELPQFWNVLKGDMSLVGTRPPTEDEWEKYSPHHRARLSVKPGLTGMWQVSGRSEIVDFEKVVELDMKYIREWSLKLDCKLLLRTIRVVFSGKGAK